MAVISFDGLSPGSGTVSAGTLSSFNFGNLPVFSAVAAGLTRMAESSPNAALLQRGIEYSIVRGDAADFTFVGANFTRSHAGPGLYRLVGLQDGQRLFALEVLAQLGSPATQRIAPGWSGIDEIRISFGPLAAEGVAAMDAFEVT